MNAEQFDTTMEADRGTTEPAMIVDVEGYEGPLDLLLMLARQQKVDLAKISILALADQYLTFIEAARQLRLELAADYLVMAAWLAFLKSRLILPQEKGPDGEPTADEMATRLRWRLQRLDAMRAASTRLMGRERLGRDVFGRGDPEPLPHPERVAAGLAPGRRGQADLLDHLVHPPRGQALRMRQPQQVATSAPAGVQRRRVQQ